MRKPLEQGSLDDAYPENVQGTPEFNVGGVERLLPEQLQMEQIVSYMEATYPVDGEPSDTYLARLPDRLTHAAMLMLGSAVDHTMPGVAFPGDVSAEDVELGTLFTPSRPLGAWAVSCAPALGPQAREHAWRPEVAGAAELSGVTILDVADAGDIPAAVEYARARSAASVALWALGARGDLPRAEADSYVATFPEAEVSAAENVLVQRREDYFTAGWVSTPAQARRRVADVAEFLRAGA